MKKTIITLVATAMLAGCASMQSESGMGAAKVKLAEPELTFTQTSYVPQVARDITGNIPVHYKVRIANKSGEPITLTQIQVQSIGVGAYALNPQSHPFKQKIAPDHFEEVDFWVPAFIGDPTIRGANGPVTLRAVAHFDSPVGQFQQIVVQQVHEDAVDSEGPQ